MSTVLNKNIKISVRQSVLYDKGVNNRMSNIFSINKFISQYMKDYRP